jgi:NADH dehydrogenase [ubiquinone] 1 alpha subcomplex assembly factor 5
MGEDHKLFDRALLRRRRARFAGQMVQHEALLAHVGAEIADRIGAILRDFPLALDLGAYHGVLGHAVAALSSVGEMIYAESVPALAALCPRPAVVCDEELLPLKDQSLNLVVSGLALHRVNDLPGALIQIRRALRPDGLFLGAALGTRSLQELRHVLIEAEAELHGGASPRIAPFADVREYGGLLQRAGFALPVTDAELLTVTYPGPRDLMREIRALGGGNVMAARRKAPLPGGTLERAEEIYRTRYGTAEGRIKASFEIVYLSGWAPHTTQQKPLAPGSAQTRLAGALHTTEPSAGDKAAYPASTKPRSK